MAHFYWGKNWILIRVFKTGGHTIVFSALQLMKGILSVTDCHKMKCDLFIALFSLILVSTFSEIVIVIPFSHPDFKSTFYRCSETLTGFALVTKTKSPSLETLIKIQTDVPWREIPLDAKERQETSIETRVCVRALLRNPFYGRNIVLSHARLNGHWWRNRRNGKLIYKRY